MDTVRNQENQLSFLLKLSDALRPLSNSVEIEEAATKIALDFMDADRCYYSTIEGENIIILHDALSGDLPSVSGTHSISSFALYKAVLSAGQPFVVDDVCTSGILDDDLKKLCLQFQYGSFINVPIIKNGKPVGLFSLVQSKPRKWTELEVQLTIEAAERTWAAVERAKAEEGLRKSEEKYRTLFDTIDQGFCIIEMIFNDAGKPVDYRFLEINPVFEKQSGLKNAVGKTMRELAPDIEEYWFARYGKVALTGESIRFTERADALERWFDVYAFRLGGEMSKNVAILFTDVTERKQAEEKIKESEIQFRSLANDTPAFMFMGDAEANVEFVNRQWLEFVGLDSTEGIGKAWETITHPEDIAPMYAIYTEAVSNLRPYQFEIRQKRKDGIYRWILWKGIPRKGSNGNFAGIMGVGFDIDEQKLAEEKLAYRTALLEAHNEASVDGILLVDAKGKIISFNQRFVEVWNMPQHIVNAKDDEAALSFAMKQLVNPQQFIDKVKYLYEHPTETSLDELEFKEGKIVERNGYPVIGEDGSYYAWSWTFKDITKRKKIQQDLKNTKDQLELTFKNIPAGVYLLNEKGEMIYVNDRGAAVYGDFTPEDLLAEKDLPALLKIADELFDRFDENGNHFGPQNSPAYISLSTGLPSQAVLMQTNKVTKETRWHYVQGAPLFDEDGKVSMVLITSTDITVQKSAEQRMRESEERFRLLSDEMPQFVWTGDAAGNLSYFNKAVYKYSGLTKEDIARDGWIQIVHPDDREENIRLWMHSISTGVDFIFEHRFKRADGEYRWQLSRAVPQRNTQGVIQQWIGTSTDIQDQKNTEEHLGNIVAERTKELQRSNDDLQQFAHVASHDLKEPIRKIKTFTGRLEEHLDGSLDEIGSRYIERIHAATNRMFNMIDGVLTYSSTTNVSTQKPELVDLKEIMKSIESDLDVALQKTGATLQYTNLPQLEGAPVLLYQLFYNLINNANKFVQAGISPMIRIESETFLEAGNRFARITVQDNGIGFKPEHAEKIFETFTRLNSKDKYEGTGLGLSLCKKIVERHGGIILASGTPDNGATFTITLPLLQNKMSI